MISDSYSKTGRQCSNVKKEEPERSVSERRRGTEDRTPKAPGVSMQLEGLGSTVSSPSGSGRSLADKRLLVSFWSENAMQLQGLGERCTAAKRHLVHFLV